MPLCLAGGISLAFPADAAPSEPRAVSEALETGAPPEEPERLTRETVSLTTRDGLKLAATLVPGSGTKAVICLHMLGGSRRDFGDLLPALAADGYWVLAVDLRGHGDSVRQNGKDQPYQLFTPVDYRLMAEGDIGAAVEFLEKRAGMKPRDIGVIGASISANAALVYSAEEPGLKTLVLLSPGLNYRGLLALASAKRLAGVSLFMAASKADAYSADSIEQIADETGVPIRVKTYEDAGHGTRMLDRAPELQEAIRKWLSETL